MAMMAESRPCVRSALGKDQRSSRRRAPTGRSVHRCSSSPSDGASSMVSRLEPRPARRTSPETGRLWLGAVTMQSRDAAFPGRVRSGSAPRRPANIRAGRRDPIELQLATRDCTKRCSSGRAYLSFHRLIFSAAADLDPRPDAQLQSSKDRASTRSEPCSCCILGDSTRVSRSDCEAESPGRCTIVTAIRRMVRQ